MRKTACSLLFFFVIVSFCVAQSTWQKAADDYVMLQLQGDPDFESDDKLEALQALLAADFMTGQQDVHLTWLLALWNADQADTSRYYTTVIKALTGKPFEKALFLLDYASALPSKRPATLVAFQQALPLLETVDSKSYVYLLALKDYAAACVAHQKFNEAQALLTKAMTLAAATTGKETTLYRDLLMAMADYSVAVGNPELAVQYQESASHIESDQLGVNQPFLHIFPNWLPYPRYDAAHGKPYLASFYLAGLFHYSSEASPYQKIMSAMLWQDALHQIITYEKEQNDFLISATLIQAVAALDQYKNNEAIQGFSSVNQYYKKQQLKGINLLPLYQSYSFLAYALFRDHQYENALTVYNELQAELKKNRFDYSKWSGKTDHNLILTHEKLDHQDTVLMLLKPYTDSKSVSFEADSRKYFTRYGDILFRYGDYARALTVYTYAYDQFWYEAEKKYEREKQNQSAGPDAMEIYEINESNTVLTIGPDAVVNAIHPFKPFGDEYTPLLLKLGKAAFLSGKYEKAAGYICDYINEFYTKLENAHFNYSRGSDLYEAYRLKNELFPAYELFQNVLMADTAASPERAKENYQRAYGHILDAKANLQFEYRHMRKVIEEGKDKSLKRDYKNYLSFREQLAKLRLSPEGNGSAIDSLTIAIDTLRTSLSTRTALVSAPATSGEKFVFWNDIRKKLGRNEASVEIRKFNRYVKGQWTNDPVYAAYIITPVSTAPEVVFLPNGTYLEGRAWKYYQNSMRSKANDSISYSIFWKPIEDKLSGIWKVNLSVDGVYNQLNVKTLYHPVKKNFLVDQVKIVQMISTKDLLTTSRDRGKISNVLLMGRPHYYLREKEKDNLLAPVENDSVRAITRSQIASGEISDLPGTEKEIQAIEKLVKKKSIPVVSYLGAASTEDALKQAQADVIHIATHGFWFNDTTSPANTDAMFNSGLLLAGVKNYAEGSKQSETEDGILTAYEVQGMNLNQTRLAILSACETALGSVETGEGVYGLQRAFRIAGADKMMMSLWKVDDEATMQLFASFYKNWLRYPDGIAQAFDKAILELKTNYPHPYYWGAFVLID